ncbi:MAG: perosamine synthetase [Actinomycetota bacterium]
MASFEDELSATLHERPTVVVSSGTLALQLALQALDIGVGDEVVVPAFTFAATANAVRLAGATPVFADVRPDDLALAPETVEPVLTERTAAVIVVHLYGQSADLSALRDLCDRRGLALVEDACQAQGALFDGAPVGTFGDAAALSFYATKNVAIGEGGAVIAADATVAARVRLMRSHGMPSRDEQVLLGTNARMTDVAAAVGRVQLRRLPAALAPRAKNAATYATSLEGVRLPSTIAGREPAWNLYTIGVDPSRRDAAERDLAAAGVATGVYYRVPLHRMPPFCGGRSLPVAERVAREVLSLPVHPGVTPEVVDRVASALRTVVR